MFQSCKTLVFACLLGLTYGCGSTKSDLPHEQPTSNVLLRLNREPTRDAFHTALVDGLGDYTVNTRLAIRIVGEATYCSLRFSGTSRVGAFGSTIDLEPAIAFAFSTGTDVSFADNKAIVMFESESEKKRTLRSMRTLRAARNEDGTVTMAAQLADVNGKDDSNGLKPNTLLLEGELPVTCSITDANGSTREDSMLKTTECREAISRFGINALVSHYQG